MQLAPRVAWNWAANARAATSRTGAARAWSAAASASGVWGHYAGTVKQLSPGDIEEALTAATAIGDDRLQKQTQGRVVPESFTHGTSEQRVRWFKRGLDSGRPKDCDTFSSASL
ncbi:MAG TPA: neutral zinc metallopeptidase [Burkholderiales bacterium]|nr:neutral zinc metallopeptidase [Burkholderiales bacterium]